MITYLLKATLNLNTVKIKCIVSFMMRFNTNISGFSDERTTISARFRKKAMDIS
jgi:hypothetical protein